MNFSFVNRVVFDVWNLICLIVVLSCWHLPPFPYLNVIPCLLLFVYFHFSDSWSDLALVCLWFYWQFRPVSSFENLCLWAFPKFRFDLKGIWLVLYIKGGGVVKVEICGLYNNLTVSLWISFKWCLFNCDFWL